MFEEDTVFFEDKNTEDAPIDDHQPTSGEIFVDEDGEDFVLIRKEDLDNINTVLNRLNKVNKMMLDKISLLEQIVLKQQKEPN